MLLKCIIALKRWELRKYITCILKYDKCVVFWKSIFIRILCVYFFSWIDFTSKFSERRCIQSFTVGVKLVKDWKCCCIKYRLLKNRVQWSTCRKDVFIWKQWSAFSSCDQIFVNKQYRRTDRKVIGLQFEVNKQTLVERYKVGRIKIFNVDKNKIKIDIIFT